MFITSVPITLHVLDTFGIDGIIENAKKIDAKRIFLCPGETDLAVKNRPATAEKIKKYSDILHRAGFETGIWVWALNSEDEKYVHMTNADGKADKITVCPTDTKYREFMGGFIASVANTGVDMIMFDDDFRFGFHGIGFGCCCKNHLKMIEEITGEKVSLPLMKEKLLSGGKNIYRDALIKANGISLESFAESMRKHLDTANENMRLGFCSCITNWDIDGTTPDRLSKLFAGKNKPFYRLIGAPYWHAMRAWGNRLGDVIELERLEATRRLDKNIEMFSEGDVFPRPRFRVSASYLEGFDTGLRVADCTDGILKYCLDYTSSPKMETGYIKAHERNKDTYRGIERLFANKENIGIRVYDKAEKYNELVIPKAVENTYEIQNLAFNAGARTAVGCSLPITYSGEGTGAIAFGGDIRAVPEDKRTGLIIDLAAAEILQKDGIDVGIEKFGEEVSTNREYYKNGEIIDLWGNGNFRKVKIKENAVTESEIKDKDGNIYPASFFYENAGGEKFFVLCYDAYFNTDALYRSYERAKQIINAIPELTGKEIPAVCTGNPDLYIQVKQGEGKTAVGMWNFSDDEIYDAEVKVQGCKKLSDTLNCNIKCENDIITVDYIKPYGFVAFEKEDIT